MEKKCTASYSWQDRFKGSQSLQILENRYLRIREDTPGKRRSFGIDVACLASEFLPANGIPTKWLGAAGAVGLVAVALSYYTATAPNFDALLYRMPAELASLIIAAFLGLSAWRRRERGYMLRTRLAGLPLLTIQSPRAADAKALAQFLEKLRPCIEYAERGRGLSPHDLRSGEVRTLRRLANESAIAEKDYETAKQQIFGSA